MVNKKFKKLLRYTLTVALTCLFTWYLIRAVKKYNKKQFGISTSEKTVNEFSLLHILLCMNMERSVNFVVAARAYIGKNGTIMGYDVTPPAGSMNGTEGNSKRWRMFHGLDDILCQEFIPERDWKFHFSQYIPVLYIAISVDNHKSGVIPIIYMVLTSPEERAEVMVLTEQSEQIPLPVHNDKLSSLAQVVKVEIRLGQELDLDKPRSPCRKGDKQDWIVDQDSFSKCVLRYFEKKRGCPRLKGQNDVNQCDEVTVKAIKHDILKLADYSRKQVYNKTGCLKACLRRLNQVKITDGFKMPRDNLAVGGDIADVLFEFSIPEAVYEIREEFVVYDASALLADCAGMAGILLGFSMIAIYDILCEGVGTVLDMRHKVNKLVDL